MTRAAQMVDGPIQITRERQPSLAIRLRNAIRRRPELIVLRALLLLAIAAILIIKLASEIREGETAAFDVAIMRGVRAATAGHTPLLDALRTIMLNVTALGSTPVLAIVVLLVAGFLLVTRRPRVALYLVAATGSGRLIVELLKQMFHRARPAVVPHLVEVSSASYPSAHATSSAIVYLTVAALLCRQQTRRAARLYLIAAALLLVILIGASRVYLGVHWPTDVAAGWAVGASWTLASVGLVEGLRRRLRR